MSALSKRMGFLPKSVKIIDAKDVYKLFLEKYKDDYTLIDRYEKGSVLIARHLITNKDADGKSMQLPPSIMADLAANLRPDGVVCVLSPIAEGFGTIKPGDCVAIDIPEHMNNPQILLGDHIYQQIPYDFITGIYTDELSRENISTDGDKPHNLIVS